MKFYRQRILQLINFVIIFLWIPYSWADIHQDQCPNVEKVIEDIRFLSGNFDQKVMTSSNKLLQKTKGVFRLDRKGLLWWEIQSPIYQLLRLEENMTYFYDQPLNQLIISPLDSNNILVNLLMNSGNLSDQLNTISCEILRNSSYRYQVELKYSDEFSQLLLLVIQEDLLIEQMHFEDASKNKVSIQFYNLSSLPISNKRFEWKMPQNTEVLNYQ